MNASRLSRVSFTDELLPRDARTTSAVSPGRFLLISGDSYLITSQLLARDADVVFAFHVSEDVRAEVAATITSPLGVITLPDHPLTRLGQLTLADCSPYPLIIPGTAWLQHSGLNVLFSEGNLPDRVVARAERPGMMKALVRAGLYRLPDRRGRCARHRAAQTFEQVALPVRSQCV